MEPDKFEELAKDPVFVKAAKNLVWNRSQGNPSIPLENKSVSSWTKGKYTRGQVDAWLSEAAKPSAQNILQGVGQGITFNFLDELRGAAKGPTARDAMRLQEEQFKEQNPGKSLLANLGGGLINPANLALMAATGGASEAPTLLKAAATGAGVGGTEGALYGAGEGTDPVTRLSDAESGGMGGAAAGLLFPAAGAVSKLLRSTTEKVGAKVGATVARAARAAGGRDALTAAATDMTDAGVTPRLGDLPGMEGVHDLAASLHFPTKQASLTIGGARRGAAPALLKDAFGNDLPAGVGTDFGEAAGTMDAARNAEFDPRYRALEAAHPQVGGSPEAVLGGTPKVGDVFADPAHPFHDKAVQLLVNEPDPVKRAALMEASMPGAPAVPPAPEYEPLARLVKRDPEVQAAWKSALREGQMGDVPDTGRPSITMLRSMRSKIQDRIENLFREGSNNAALKLKTSINTLNDVLDHETGGVGKSLDAEYRAAMDEKRALLNGRVWWNAQESDGIPHSIAGLKTMMSTYTPEELQAFRTGVASSITQDMEHSTINRNIAQELQNMSSYKQSLLRSVYDHGSHLDEFMFKVKQMAQAAKMNAAGGGSATAGRQAAMDAGDPTLSLTDLKNPFSAARKVAQAATSAVVPSKEAFGEALGNLTLTRGTPAIDAALKMLLAPESGVPAFLQNSGVAGAMGTAGAVDASQP